MLELDFQTLATLTMRLLLAGVFAGSAIGKFRKKRSINPLLVAVGLGRWRYAVTTLSLLEALLVIVLVADAPDAAEAAVAALTLFLLVLGYAAVRGYRGDCGCFGEPSTGTIFMSLFRTMTIWLVAVALVITQQSDVAARERWSLDLTAAVFALTTLAMAALAGYVTYRVTRVLGSANAGRAAERNWR